MTSGLPDPLLVVGDWTGEVASRQEREALAFRDLRAGVRKVTCEALRRREHWAKSDVDGAVARAVAYQSIAGDLIRLLDAVDAAHGPLTPDVSRVTT